MIHIHYTCTYLGPSALFSRHNVSITMTRSLGELCYIILYYIILCTALYHLDISLRILSIYNTIYTIYTIYNITYMTTSSFGSNHINTLITYMTRAHTITHTTPIS